MKYSKEANADAYLLSLVEEDDFTFDLYRHGLFYIDVEEFE